MNSERREKRNARKDTCSAIIIYSIMLHAMLASGSNANDETWTGLFLFIVLLVTKHAMFIIERCLTLFFTRQPGRSITDK